MITNRSFATPALLAAGAGSVDQGEPIEIPLGWSRIGRSPMAEIRLADPTVSRRHALIVRTEDERLRVLDDRSLTGIYLNGERVRWAELRDGDELMIGGVNLLVKRPASGVSAAA
ncbi:MAG: FHA domain-containing protein [Thermoleophilia bacterium]|nr:FHA domain-containing protein [Thermoleophilia bacterium]